MNGRFAVLVRREFWECRMLWMAPLLGAVLVVGACMFGTLHFDSMMQRDPRNLAGGGLTGVAVFIGAVGCLAIVGYLADSLFTERKDRSILFWKSLPVSDVQTVLSKLAVALLVMPVGLLLLAVVIHFAATGIVVVRYDGTQDVLAGFWSGWMRALGRMGIAWVFAVLWYMPVAAYLMLASVIAKRAPLLYAVLPVLVVVMWERLMLGGAAIGQFVVARLIPGGGANRLLDLRANPWLSFQDPGLWIGLAVACGMLYIVIRLRRYRDDT